MQLQPHMDEPVGMALYEMKGGHLSNIMMQGGALEASQTTPDFDLETTCACFVE